MCLFLSVSLHKVKANKSLPKYYLNDLSLKHNNWPLCLQNLSLLQLQDTKIEQKREQNRNSTLCGMNGICEKQVDKLMPCPFTGPKMFCAGPNFLSQSKNLIAFSASSKTFVPAQKIPTKTILLNANHLFVWHKMFVTATICN